MSATSSAVRGSSPTVVRPRLVLICKPRPTSRTAAIAARVAAKDPGAPRKRSWVAASGPSRLSAMRRTPASANRRIASRVRSGVTLGATATRIPWRTASSMIAKRSGRFRGSPPVSTRTPGSSSRTCAISCEASLVVSSRGSRAGTALARQWTQQRSHARVTSQIATTGYRARSRWATGRPGEQPACRRGGKASSPTFPKSANAGGLFSPRMTGTRVVSREAMDFTVPEEIERLCDGVRRFMDEHVYPLERQRATGSMEVGGPAYPPAVRAVQAKAKALGYWAFHLPKEAGGAGIPFMHYVLVNEILGRSPLAPVCVGSQAPDSGNAEILWRFGTDEQKARWLRPLVDGRDPQLLLDDRARGRGLRSARCCAPRRCATATTTSSTGTSGSRAARTAPRFAIVMAMTNPEQREPVPALQPDHRADRHAGLPDRARHPGHGRRRQPPRRDPLRGLPRAGDQPPRRRGHGLRRSRRSGSGPGRIHHCMRWLGVAQRAFELMCRYANAARGVRHARSRARRTSRTGSPRRAPTSRRRA